MKKSNLTFIIISLLFISIHAQAQLKFGARAGLNLANMRLKGIPEGANLETIPSFHLGAVIEYSFNEQFALEADLLLSGKGTRMVYTSNYAGVIYTSKGRISPYYLEIPVLAIYKINLSKFDVHLFAGPYAGFGLFGKIKKSYSAIQLPPGETLESIGIKNSSINVEYGSDGNSTFKRTDVGLNVGAGLQFNKLQFRLQYGFSLLNLDPNGDSNYDKKNKVIGISVGYIFGN